MKDDDRDTVAIRTIPHRERQALKMPQGLG